MHFKWDCFLFYISLQSLKFVEDILNKSFEIRRPSQESWFPDLGKHSLVVAVSLSVFHGFLPCKKKVPSKLQKIHIPPAESVRNSTNFRRGRKTIMILRKISSISCFSTNFVTWVYSGIIGKQCVTLQAGKRQWKTI